MRALKKAKKEAEKESQRPLNISAQQYKIEKCCSM